MIRTSHVRGTCDAVYDHSQQCQVHFQMCGSLVFGVLTVALKILPALLLMPILEEEDAWVHPLALEIFLIASNPMLCPNPFVLVIRA